MNTLQSLPGISHIYIVSCSNLTPHLMLQAIANMNVAVYASLQEVPFNGEPTLECANEYDNHGRLEKVTLSFSSPTDIDAATPSAFVIEDANGARFLIGAREMPFPIVKKTKKAGTPTGDPAAFAYEVTLTNIRALIRCSC